MVHAAAGRTVDFHGMSNTKEHNAWRQMKQRCYNKNSTRYKTHGARGIRVCERWLKFSNFYADMGDKPEGRSIDRIDNDGDYSPENCRWATIRQQQNNTRRNCFIEYAGHRLTRTQWSRVMGINAKTIEQRLKSGWGIGDSLTRPSQRMVRK